jgi:hypothetical protein
MSLAGTRGNRCFASIRDPRDIVTRLAGLAGRFCTMLDCVDTGFAANGSCVIGTKQPRTQKRDQSVTLGHTGMNHGPLRRVSRGYHAVITLRSWALSATLEVRNIWRGLIVINGYELDKLRIF